MHLLNFILRPFIPLVQRWIERQEKIILKKGRVLTSSQRRDAERAGVAHPEKIRVMAVKAIRPPQDFLLGLASKMARAFDSDTAGCTLRYGIYIRQDCQSYREHRGLYLHEFVHVAQYERYDSIKAFLIDYLKECIDPGYPHGPLERQADRTAAKIIRRC